MKVQILLSTFNGEKYLEEQIESLINQVGIEWNILVRDDGSTDNTKIILSKYQEKGILDWYEGENIKSANSYFDLISNAHQADFYAFCDQDDVWDKDKIKVAVECLQRFNKNEPTLYFSKAKMVDKNLEDIKGRDDSIKPYEFGTALLRNNVTGCTIVINNFLLEKIRRYTPQNAIMHDSWIYLVCKALNGKVVYDDQSHIKYRQHENNVIGGDIGFLHKLRHSSLFTNKGIRYRIAVELYNEYKEDITITNLLILKKIVNYKNSIRSKFALLFDKDIKNHLFFQDVLLAMNILLNNL